MCVQLAAGRAMEMESERERERRGKEREREGKRDGQTRTAAMLLLEMIADFTVNIARAASVSSDVCPFVCSWARTLLQSQIQSTSATAAAATIHSPAKHHQHM